MHVTKGCFALTKTFLKPVMLWNNDEGQNKVGEAYSTVERGTRGRKGEEGSGNPFFSGRRKGRGDPFPRKKTMASKENVQ